MHEMDFSSLKAKPYDGSNYLAWKSKMEKYVMSIDINLWSIIVEGYDIKIRMKRKHELNSDEKKTLALDKRAFDILYDCLNDAHKSLILEYEISNANHLWKWLYDQFVDAMEYGEIEERSLDIETNEALPLCLVGHLKKVEDGKDIESLKNGPIVFNDNAFDLDLDDLLDDDNCDDDDIEMSSDQLEKYALMMTCQVEKLSKENRKLKEKLKNVSSKLEEKEKEIDDLKHAKEIFLSSSNDSSVEINELKLLNENLLKENVQLIEKNKFYEKLQQDYDAMRVRVNDLSSSLEKLTLGKENLEKLLGKQKVVGDKSGLGFVDNGTTNAQASTTTFVRSSSFEKKKNVTNHAWMYVSDPKVTKRNEKEHNVSHDDSFYMPKKMNMNVKHNHHGVGFVVQNTHNNHHYARNNFGYGSSMHVKYPSHMYNSRNNAYGYGNHTYQAHYRSRKLFMPYRHSYSNMPYRYSEYYSYRHANVTCHYCGKIGHTSPKCYSRMKVENGTLHWLPKSSSNTKGSKKVWIPKTCV